MIAKKWDLTKMGEPNTAELQARAHVETSHVEAQTSLWMEVSIHYPWKRMHEDTGIEVLAFCWLGIMIHDSVFGSPCWDCFTVCFFCYKSWYHKEKQLGDMRHNKKVWNRDINQPNNLCPTKMWMRCQTIQYIPIG